MNGRQFKKLAAVAKMVGGTKNDMEPLQHLYAQSDGTFFVTDHDNAFLTIHPDNLPAFNVNGEKIPSAYLPSLKSFANKVSVKDELSFSVESDTISVEKGNITKRWNGKFGSEKMPVNPLSGFDPGEIVFADDGDTVIDALTRLDKMASTDDYREALNGIYLATDKGEWVATDGHKLGTIPTAGVYPSHVREGGPVFILPQTTRKILNKIKPVGEIEIYYGPTFRVEGHECNYAYIRCLDEEGWEYELAVRMPAGPYPPYRKAYPNENDYLATFELPLDTLEQITKYRTVDGCRVYLDNNPRVVSYKISCNSSDTNGETEIALPIEIEPLSDEFDPDTPVGFNPHFLGEFAKLFENNPTVYYTGPKTALVMVDETEGVTGLLMPIKLPGE